MLFQLVAGLILAIGVFLIVYGIYRGKRPAGIGNRLRNYSSRDEESPAAAGQGKSSLFSADGRLDKAVSGKSFAANIASNLARADVKMTVTEFIVVRVMATAGGFGAGVFLGRSLGTVMFVVGIICAIAGLFVPNWYIKFRQKRRISSFNKQLPDAIILLASSLRAGYSLLQSMDLISKEGQPPLAMELGRVVKEVGLGLTSEEALANLLRRVPSDDLDLLITAINIQHEVGGNLAQMLEIIGHTIRERVRIKGEISVLTAQGRLSGYILTGLPIALAGALMLMGGDYMRPMFTFPWLVMPVCSGIMIFVGFMVIQKIVAIEV
jgi:tight adherence protein B